MYLLGIINSKMKGGKYSLFMLFSLWVFTFKI